MTPERWQQIDTVFQQVVDAPVAERHELLRQLCGGDAQLRDEVLSLLEHDQQTSRLLATPPQGNAISKLIGAATGLQTLPIRQTEQIVGRFQLIELLSVNALSEVWSARLSSSASELAATGSADARDDKTAEFACKFLRDASGSPKRVQRFRQEVMFLSHFRHPGIAELVDAGHDEQVPYFVTRFVSGEDILAFADQRRLSVEDRARLFCELCDAVIHAHRNKVVHRDLKPANVLVDEHEIPVVLDFGISKYIGEDDQQRGFSQLTATQERPMTPAYASPEQLRGEPVTVATDIYALGLILYELLAGHHPYSDNAVRTEVDGAVSASLFDRACVAQPKSLSRVVLAPALPIDPSSSTLGREKTPGELANLRQVDVQSLSQSLRRFESVVATAISKRPAIRQATVAQLRREVEQAIWSPAPLTSSQRWKKRAMVGALGLVAFALGSLLARQFPNSPNVADSQLQSATREDARASTSPNPSLEPDSNWQSISLGLLRSIDEAKLLSEHSDVLAELPLAARADLMEHALAASQSELTTFLLDTCALESTADLQQLSAEQKSALSRGTAWLRRPTLGLRLYGSEFLAARTSDSEQRQAWLAKSGDPLEVRRSIVRILLDAGLSEAAFEWTELALVDLPSTHVDDLLRLEACVRIGWAEGGSELARQLDSRSANFTDTQRARFQFLQALLFESEERIDALRTFTDVADQAQWPALLIQSEALIAAAEVDAQSGNLESAVDRLTRVVSTGQRAGQVGFAVWLRALKELADVHFTDNQSATAAEVALQGFEQAKRSNELGSAFTMWLLTQCAGEIEPAERAQALQAFESYEAVYRRDDYLHRALTVATCNTLIQIGQDWTSADEPTQRLVALERSLSGEDSVEFAMACAQRMFVLRQLNRASEAPPLSQVVLDFAKQHGSLPLKNPVDGFLRPIAARGTDGELVYPAYLWIQKYYEQRLNSVESQRQMVAYEAQELGENNTDIAQLLLGER